MSTTSTFVQGTRTSLLALSTLASATYLASSAYVASTNSPVDIAIEVTCNPNGTPTSPFQLEVYIQASLDGTNFQTGPTSGTDATNNSDLTLMGTVPCNDTNDHTRMFSVYSTLGFIPKQFKIVCRNNMGVALTSGNVYTAEISAVSA